MRRRLAAVVAGLVIGVIGGRMSVASEPVALAPGVRVDADRAEQLDVVRWAVGRFEAAGLRVPRLEIVFHRNGWACRGHVAYADGSRIDVCTVLVNATTRRVLLHEIAHLWLNEHATDAVRTRFLELRDLPSWNASGDEWRERGCEHAAEILAWELGERILTPSIDDDGPRELDAAFELLTGRPSPPG